MTEENGFLPYPKGFATAAIHHAQEPENWDSMAIVAPIVTSTTYKQFGPADFKVSNGKKKRKNIIKVTIIV